jgi:putative ABC transport system permease protein
MKHRRQPDSSPRPVPLAWAQLTHRKVRLAVALGGIAFANVLIFMQLGFRALFTTGATALPEALAGDLFLSEPSARFISGRGFERIRLYQAGAIAGVASVAPLYVNGGAWAYDREFISYDIRVFGFNPQQPVFKSSELLGQVQTMAQPDAILFDRLSRYDLGPVPEQFTTGNRTTALLNNRRLTVVGLFTMGNSFFVGEGNVLLSEATYQNLFGAQALQRVSLGIVTLQPDANLAQVQASLRAQVPGVVVLTRQDLIQREIAFQESTPAGPIFSFGAIMGFIIGVVIVYQVLYADISDHLEEYATLKAMGYSNWGLLQIIFQESLMLGSFGFVPGAIAAHFMYQLLAQVTRLSLVMRPDVAIMVFLLTLCMCLISAAIASNKLRSADPADIFN